jgi:hypothetical protein
MNFFSTKFLENKLLHKKLLDNKLLHKKFLENELLHKKCLVKIEFLQIRGATGPEQQQDRLHRRLFLLQPQARRDHTSP